MKEDKAVQSSKYEEKKRRAILAAAKVFALKGFHGATTEDIATELGIQQGSLYYYFKSKEQALQEVCECGMKDYVARMRGLCQLDVPVQQTLRSVIDAHLSNYRNQYSAMKVHNDQRLYLSKDRRVVIKKLGTEYRTLLEDLLRKGIEAGLLRNDIDTHFVAYSIIGLGNAWGSNLMRDESIDLSATVERFSNLVLGGILD